jgi:DNA-binding MarR family transcriptional regulator
MNTPITEQTLRALRRILRVTDQGGRKLASVTGLTPSQMMVLQQIDRTEMTTPSAVAVALKFGQATVTNIVDRLEAAGYATRQRNERDKRQFHLHITDAGRQVLDSAPDLLQERFRDRFEALATWEQAMILAGLERLGHLLDATDIDAAPLIDAGIIDRELDA